MLKKKILKTEIIWFKIIPLLRTRHSTVLWHCAACKQSDGRWLRLVLANICSSRRQRTDSYGPVIIVLYREYLGGNSMTQTPLLISCGGGKNHGMNDRRGRPWDPFRDTVRQVKRERGSGDSRTTRFRARRRGPAS